MIPAENYYTAMKVNEWKEGATRKEMRENTLQRKQKKKEKKFRREAKNEALRNMINRQVHISTED